MTAQEKPSIADRIAAKEAELAAAREAMEANFNRPVGGRSRTKQFGRRINAQLRRAGEHRRTIEQLEREIVGLHREATAPTPVPLDLTRLPYAKAIRTRSGWYRVLKVNRKSVVVEVPPGWDNRFPLSRILEIRERADAPAPAAEPVGFDGTVISGPHAPVGSVRVCDVGGEQLDGPWFLVSAGTANDWTADRGASCATHCGQPEPAAGATLTPGPRAGAPTGYAAAVEAAAERDTPGEVRFSAGWSDGEVTVIRDVRAGISGPFGEYPAADLAEAEAVLRAEGYALAGPWTEHTNGHFAPLVRVPVAPAPFVSGWAACAPAGQ